MKWSETNFGDSIIINPESIGRDYIFSEIEYVDISSVGSGTIAATNIISKDQAPSRAKRIVRAHDTIISTVRPRNRSFYYFKSPSENTIVSTGFAVLRAIKGKMDSRYLYYVISNSEFTAYLCSNEQGAAYPAVNTEVFERCTLSLPPLPAQQRIASILSAYDDLIENNLKRIKLLEEAAQNIYREWFVYFRFPGYEMASWYVDDKGRRLPEGWKYLNLDQVCDLIMGQSPSSEYYNDHGDGLPFHQGVTDFGDRFVTNTTYCSSPTRIAKVGDILCSVRAPVGRLNITLDQIIIGRGLSAMRNKNGNQSFLYYQLKSHFHTEDMIGGGSIFNSVTKKVLSEQELLLPSEGVVSDFENIVVPIDNQIQRLHRQNIFLKEARDILLPRLMNQSIAV